MTVCPEHGERCEQTVNCQPWREQRREDAEGLLAVLRKAHQARVNGGGLTQQLNAYSPVPAIRDREEDPTLMIWAYALLVNELMMKIATLTGTYNPHGVVLEAPSAK